MIYIFLPSVALVLTVVIPVASDCIYSIDPSMFLIVVVIVPLGAYYVSLTILSI